LKSIKNEHKSRYMPHICGLRNVTMLQFSLKSLLKIVHMNCAYQMSKSEDTKPTCGTQIVTTYNGKKHRTYIAPQAAYCSGAVRHTQRQCTN